MPKQKNIFLLLSLLLVGLCSLWLIDLLKGDGNGYVAGVNLVSLLKISSLIWLIYSFWYAFKQKVGWLQNVLVQGLVVVLTVALLEWVCGIILKKQAEHQPKISGPIHSKILDDVLGYKPTPDTTHTGVRMKGDSVIYSISYQTDTNSLRITPTDSTKIRTKYAQFYGCSMTFGEGVQSNETLPYYFGQLTDYKPYNFAYSGYGPSQCLARLETQSPRKIVKETSGIGFYIYINDHVNRVIGTMTNYSYNGGYAPYFHYVGDSLKHDGLFRNVRRLRGAFYEILLKSNILKLFKIGYPFKITEADYTLTAEVLAASSRAYQQQFGNDNFYVIIYPTTIDSSLIIRLLKERKVKVLDYSKLFNPLDKRYAIAYDEHPTAQANEILIKRLIGDMSEK